MKSPLCRYVSMASCILVTLVAFDFGLGAFDSGMVMNSNLVMQNMQLFQYLVFAASLWNGYLIVMSLQGKKCKF